ncbi:hypothetical protein EVAR_3961_1 [Eumeta japonica]|uniref:Uncharacterized protein n=1 Tax=Eumeta variegata TaxID=151549 RepID=A0A4C1SQX9_EUMVA|nr:hypothetical protein EVAR_3961_1 [Eumeta japonica]
MTKNNNVLRRYTHCHDNEGFSEVLTLPAPGIRTCRIEYVLSRPDRVAGDSMVAQRSLCRKMSAQSPLLRQQKVTWVVELGEAPQYSFAPYEKHLHHSKSPAPALIGWSEIVFQRPRVSALILQKFQFGFMITPLVTWRQSDCSTRSTPRPALGFISN